MDDLNQVNDDDSDAEKIKQLMQDEESAEDEEDDEMEEEGEIE